MIRNSVTCVNAPLSVPSVPWGAFPSDQREHQPARPLVVHRPDPDPRGHRHLADETPQELLRGQEAGVTPLCVCVSVCVCVCVCVSVWECVCVFSTDGCSTEQLRSPLSGDRLQRSRGAEIQLHVVAWKHLFLFVVVFLTEPSCLRWFPHICGTYAGRRRSIGVQQPHSNLSLARFEFVLLATRDADRQTEVRFTFVSNRN